MRSASFLPTVVGTALALLTVAAAMAEQPTTVIDGRLDLRHWKPATDGPAQLDGTWDFYWRQLVPPGQEAAGAQAVPIEVPSFWHRTAVGQDGRQVNAGRGFGTYRLRVLLPAKAPPLALRLGNINTAAAVYAQGVRVWAAGRVTDDARTAQPGYRPGVALLPPTDTQELELVVHVSSFEATRGGLDDTVWLGRPEDLIEDRARALSGLGLLVGGLLIMGIYHLFLFALRRRSKISLYFSLLCLSAVGRLGLSDELLLLELWPAMPWWLLVKGMYFFAFSILSAFAFYLQALWPQPNLNFGYRCVQLIGAVAGLVVLATPVGFFTRGLVFLEAYVVAGNLLSTIVFVGAMRRQEPGRWIYASGFLFVAIGGLHDVAVSQNLIVSGLYLGPIGIFVFLLAQSAILAQRFSTSLVTVEAQRAELQQLVDQLESEKRERKRYEELSFAASGLAHETKNPLGIIRGLAQRLVAAPDAEPATRQRAGQILDQADRAASRLGDFLSYARVRDPRMAPVRLDAILRYAGEVLAPDLEAKEIPCRVTAEAMVLADEEMLLQIVLNLLLNSIAASQAGEALELRFEIDAGENRGRLAVIDHGAGIAPDMLERVRRPYVTGRADGHGLGLALVERLADLQGWRLHIESTLGVGTRVEIIGLEIAPRRFDEPGAAQLSP